jgi:glycosyltransferase involved in cell wall biosynthesis
MNANKKLSIISVSLNSSQYLEQTIQSISNQTYNNKEYIIIDGGSIDGTLDIIKKYDDKIDYWISEPDKGIADAMNKGLKAASGDYVLFIHSDDYLIDNTVIERAFTHINGDFDLYIFQVLFEQEGVRRLSLNRDFSWKTNFKMGSCHQGHICSRFLLETLEGFDTTFRINMDYDFVLRAYRNGAAALSVNMPIALMRQIGISSQDNWEGLVRRLNEEHRVHEKNTANNMMSLAYVIYWFFYFRYRRIIYLLK